MTVKKTQLTLRLDFNTRCKIQKLAIMDKRSISNMILQILKREIRAYEAQHGEIVLTPEDLALE